MKAIFLHLFALFGCIYATEKIRYDGYRLYKIFVPDDTGLESLKNVQDDDGYHFWLRPRVNESANVMISPAKIQEFMKFANTSKLDPELMMDDVQKYIDDENPVGNLRSTLDWHGYHRLDVIYRWLDSLVIEYPNIVKPITGGSSYEGRSIRGVKLSYKEGNPGIFMEGGIHAREWISPAVVTYILNELILSDDPRIRYMAESYDWYFFPVFNPDGYEYTHTRISAKRDNCVVTLIRHSAKYKVQSPHFFRIAYGVKLEDHLEGVAMVPTQIETGISTGQSGTSPNPCSDTYPGNRPFSETETRTMSQYIDSIHNKLFAYIGFHSYSQLLLIPYGHTNQKIDNYRDLLKIGSYSINALSKRYGTTYKVGNIAEIIYPAAGGSMDWVRGTYNIPVTFTYELRDKGRYGFILPANQIIPTAQETMDSLVAMFQQTAKLGYGSSKTIVQQ